MRDNDGRKLDHQTLEAFRIRAVRQILDEGALPEDVAATLGLNRSTVYGWLSAYRHGGEDALRAKPIPGRPQKLCGEQVARLHSMLVETDPRQLSFACALWRREIVRQVIHRQFGIALSAASVSRLLAAMGFWPQPPLQRAREREPQRLARWKNEVFPALRTMAKKERARLFYVQESVIRPEPAPSSAGRPAPSRGTGKGGLISVISAVTAKGTLRFAAYDAEVSVETFADFCHRLLHDVDHPAYLVLDEHPAHRARAITELPAARDGQLKLFFLPGDATAVGARK